ncbi:unnamed protein product [Nezara viridula]|uniref:Uncharacterized protein n=1 Tax=Nezara viridula TaxID=85310 RepID=A0A9P0H2J4_NEZVI|nr:unnamed protein product [Nezara viridula]
MLNRSFRGGGNGSSISLERGT